LATSNRGFRKVVRLPWLHEAIGTAEWTGIALGPIFDGFQQSVAYRYQTDADDPGAPVDRIRVRSLMTPPGIPDFFTRRRFLEPGRTVISGRA